MTIFEDYSQIIRKRENLPEDWHVYEAAHGPDEAPKGFMKVKGCKFANYVRGPKKGQPRICGGKLDKESNRTFFISLKELGL